MAATSPLLNAEKQRYVDELCAVVPEIQSVWLIGSRANGTARPDSDWDFLAFGVPRLRQTFAKHLELRKDDVDVFVRDEDGDFRAPWPDSDRVLERIEWKQVSPTQATYMATKPKRGLDGQELFCSDVHEGTGIRVWPQS